MKNPCRVYISRSKRLNNPVLVTIILIFVSVLHLGNVCRPQHLLELPEEESRVEMIDSGENSRAGRRKRKALVLWGRRRWSLGPQALRCSAACAESRRSRTRRWCEGNASPARTRPLPAPTTAPTTSCNGKNTWGWLFQHSWNVDDVKELPL